MCCLVLCCVFAALDFIICQESNALITLFLSCSLFWQENKGRGGGPVRRSGGYVSGRVHVRVRVISVRVRVMVRASRVRVGVSRVRVRVRVEVRVRVMG